MTIPVKARRDGNTVVSLGEFESGDRVPPEHLELFVGAAESLDVNGNPTPNTTTFPPANYPLGTVFFANSGPTAQDNGTGVSTTYAGIDMRFRRTGSSGSEAWTWDGGSFRASNSNGDYQRFADGTQECEETGITLSHSSSTLLVADWTFPAVFAAAPALSVNPTTEATSVNFKDLNAARAEVPTTTSAPLRLSDRNGGLLAGDTADVQTLARGKWK